MILDDFFSASKKHYKLIQPAYKEVHDLLGVDKIAYVEVDKDNNTFLSFDHIAWAERFMEKQYFQKDAMIVNPSNMQPGFSFLGNVMDEKKIDNEIIEDGVIRFNWHYNFSFVQKNQEGGYCLLCFGTSKDNNQIFTKIFNNVSKLEKLFYKTHQQLRLICKKTC